MGCRNLRLNHPRVCGVDTSAPHFERWPERTVLESFPPRFGVPRVPGAGAELHT